MELAAPMKPKALDLFCGAGGATKGLQRAGFHVTGVDMFDQPRYCGDVFVHGNALANYGQFYREFDFIWASPPCQAHTSLKSMHNAKRHDDLIGRTRVMLDGLGAPYVIENVVGAPLRNPFTLCGTMFGLQTENGAELRRHRIFEANFGVEVPKCQHGNGGVIGVYGGHYRNRRRPSGLNRLARDFTAEDGKRAMGITWMTGEELSQSIPPAYSKFIAEQWLAQRNDMMEAA
jgi:DNA (cytosine-5)-methyltransferase 1